MRICYLIQSHKNQFQILRLVRAIKQSDANSFVLVSHDFGFSFIDKGLFESIPGVRVISCQGGRANFQLMQSYLEAIDWLLENNIEFDWVVNLSGQDYPIKPLDQVAAFLAQTQYDGFMEYFKVFSDESPWGLREGETRYCFRYWQIIKNLPSKVQKPLRLLKVVNYIQPFFRVNFSFGFTFGIRTKTPFNDGVICYGGSTLCTLSRACVTYLHTEWKRNSELVRFYRHTGIPTESFFQTLLLNSGRFNIYNDCKFYFDFAASSNGHPRFLTSKDFSTLVKHPAHFARKLDVILDREIFDLLDAHILPNRLTSVSRDSGVLTQ